MTILGVCGITQSFIFRMENLFQKVNSNICKFYEVDHTRTIAFAIGRTEHTVQTKVTSLRKKGLFDYYKNLNKHW